MLAIRLSRKGKKKQPTYRLIVNEKAKDPWGNYLENLGTYNPKTKELNLKADRIKYWLSKGAQPSNTVWNILVDKGIVEGKKKTVTKLSAKRKAKLAEAEKISKPAENPAPVKPAAEKSEEVLTETKPA